MPRPARTGEPVHMRFAEFELDEANAALRRQGRTMALAPTPFNLLCALARQPGVLLSKETLLDTVWGHQFVTESVLKTAVSDLRIALGDNPREPRFIETVPRRGYRFVGAPMPMQATTPAPAAPAQGQAPASPSFVGRAGAMAQLRRAWDRACSGRRAMVWVAGEPGIGKTALIEQFVAGMNGAVACARGQCVEHHGTGEPYLPVLEALAELCRKDETLPALLRGVAPTWMLQLPWLSTAEERDALRRELSGVGPERMLREMGELLDRYTEQRPLLLVTEDLHWSDRATIQLIDHVARRRGRACLLWLASHRVAEVVATEHPLGSLRRELRLHRLCDEIVLDPFSEAEVADFVAGQSSSLARDEAFVRALHERTDGVPLFVSSMITEIVEGTVDDADARTRLATVDVPENLAALIDHHIARLDTDARALLTAAAVCGAEFRAETVAMALDREPSSVALAFDDLVRGHVWLARAPASEVGDAPVRSHAFRHALFRHVLYDRTPPVARVRLHASVGAALERERSTGTAVAASELAMHFERGRQAMNALRCYAEAARAALQHFSPASSLGHTARALALLPQAQECEERRALELEIATLHGAAAFPTLGVGSDTRDAFARAYALLSAYADHPMRGRLLYGYGYVLSMRGEYAQALTVAQRALSLAAASNDTALTLVGCILHGQVDHLQGRPQAARSWFERGLDAAESLDNAGTDIFVADTKVTLRGLLALQCVQRGQVEQARAHAAFSRERALGLRHPMTRLDALWRHALLEVRLGDAGRVAALADEMQRLVDEFALGQGRCASRWFRGWARAVNGAPREGHRLIRDAYEENSRLGMRSGGSEVLGYAAQALLLAGDLDAAHAQLREARQVAEDLAERIYLPQLLLLEAAIARGQDRFDASAASTREAIDEARAQEAPWLELLALLDLCEFHVGTAEELSELEALVATLPEAAGTAAVARARSRVVRAAGSR